jgi:hypothetical protein
MPYIHEQWVAHQKKRWMRHDANRFLLPRFVATELKFDPHQPRVPAGNPDGGQWTLGDTTTELSARMRTQLATRISSTRQQECDLQYRQDTFKCNLIGTAACWRQANFRYAQCMIGGYVPPLYF